LFTLDRDVGKPSLLSRFSRGRLPLGRILMATCHQLLASLATACSTLAGVRLAFPRSVTPLACLSLYTFGHRRPFSYPFRPSQKPRRDLERDRPSEGP
jgi:hypothetical protein